MKETANRFVQIAVKPETHALIAELAELTHRTRSGAVHAAVEEVLRKIRKAA